MRTLQIQLENRSLVAEKNGMRVMVAWVQPDGVPFSKEDKAIADFARFAVTTLTPIEESELRAAVADFASEAPANA